MERIIKPMEDKYLLSSLDLIEDVFALLIIPFTNHCTKDEINSDFR